MAVPIVSHEQHGPCAPAADVLGREPVPRFDINYNSLRFNSLRWSIPCTRTIALPPARRSDFGSAAAFSSALEYFHRYSDVCTLSVSSFLQTTSEYLYACSKNLLCHDNIITTSFYSHSPSFILVQKSYSTCEAAMDASQHGNSPMQHQYMQNWNIQTNVQGNTLGNYQQSVCNYPPQAFVAQNQQTLPNHASSYPSPVQQQPTYNSMVNGSASAPPLAQNSPRFLLSVTPFQVPVLSNGSQFTAFPLRDRGPNHLRDAFYASPRPELRGASRLQTLETCSRRFHELLYLYQTEKRAHISTYQELQDIRSGAEANIVKYRTELEETKFSLRTLQQVHSKQARELEKVQAKVKDQEGDMSRLQQSTGIKDRAEALKRLAAAVESHCPIPQSSSLRALGYQHKAWDSPAIAQMVRDCYPRDCKCDETHTRLQQQQVAAKSATSSSTPPDTAFLAAGMKRPRDSSSEEMEHPQSFKYLKNSASETSPKPSPRQPTQPQKCAQKQRPKPRRSNSPKLVTGWDKVGACQTASPEIRQEDGSVETSAEETPNEIFGQPAQQLMEEDNEQVEQTLEKNLFDLAVVFNSAGDDLDNVFTEKEVAEMEESLNSDEAEEVDTVQPPDDYSSELAIVDEQAPGQISASATGLEINTSDTAEGSSLEWPDSQETLIVETFSQLPCWWSWENCNAMAEELAARNSSPSDDEDSDEEADEEEEVAQEECANGQETQISYSPTYPRRQIREESEESEEL